MNVSPTTVSEALRGVARVNPETARLIRETAAAAGYRLNPLTSAMMSEVRRSAQSRFRGTLAIIMLEEPQRPARDVNFFREQIRGAGDRADQLGYSTELFTVGPQGVSLRRLDSILQSRGIHGIILLPAWNNPDFSQLDWRLYAGVYADYMIEKPSLNSVCPNHFRSMTCALQNLYERGYRRPGLVLQKQQDNRLQHVWEGGFLAFQNSTPDVIHLPPLVDRTISRDAFIAWFRRFDPDVVIGHLYPVMDWMRECGARIPETHGFFCLNLLRPPVPCAGLDQQPHLIGERAAEIVIAQLFRNELGVPAHPALTTIPARFIDGPTIRSGAGKSDEAPGIDDRAALDLAVRP